MFELTEVSCGTLEAPENGYLIKNVSGHYGDRIQFACHKGYEMIGSDSSRCLDSGSWDKPAPKCTGNSQY